MSFVSFASVFEIPYSEDSLVELTYIGDLWRRGSEQATRSPVPSSEGEKQSVPADP
jgi:hypothetical protein